MNRIDGVSFEQAWESRLDTFLDAEPQVPLPIISLETLVRNKRATAREKDLEDLKFLERF